jgi:hypothetical protein
MAGSPTQELAASRARRRAEVGLCSGVGITQRLYTDAERDGGIVVPISCDDKSSSITDFAGAG